MFKGRVALLSSPAGPSPNPSPVGRGVICEVTPIGLLAWGVVRSFSHRTHSGPSPNPSPAGRGVICEVTPTGLLTQFLGSSFSHRAHRVHGVFLRTVSSPQKASGIQSSQSVTANVGTNKGQQVAYILLIGVSR